MKENYFKFCDIDFGYPEATQTAYASEYKKDTIAITYKDNKSGSLMSIPVMFTGYYPDSNSAINAYNKIINERTLE